MKLKKPITLLIGWVALALALVHPARSAPESSTNTSTGIIEGRVFDSGRGQYLENARVTLAGTSQETFTDAAGQYRFANVPAGSAKVNVFFTGLALQTDVVEVEAARTVQHNVTMTAAGKKEDPNTPIKLDAFVVSTSKEMSGAAIAINEQRFARNIKTVIASDEFGIVVDGTPGELLKYLPGIAMDSTAGDARGVALDGVQAVYTPITLNGFDYAGASAGTTQRVVSLDNININSISLMERVDSPTPESPASALAGSINFVPRSAFTLTRPQYVGTAFLAWKDDDRHINKTAGPFLQPDRKVQPGFNFSATVPVNDRFGYTISGSNSTQYAPEVSITETWNGVSVATNGTTLPSTTPDKPYMSSFAYFDGGRMQTNASLGLTLDYKLSPTDIVSVSYQKAYLHTEFNSHSQNFNLGSVIAWGPTFDHGGVGAGTVTQGDVMRDEHVVTETPTFTYRHNGPVWKSEAGFAYSRSSYKALSGDKGFFNSHGTIQRGLTVNFDNNFYLRPGAITITDATGAAVDPYTLSGKTLTTAVDASQDRVNAKTSAYINLSRHFDVRGVPVTIKGGLDVRRDMRDGILPSQSYTFVGPDHVANTADDNALQVIDESFSQRNAPYGFPKTQWTNAAKLYTIYREHPDYFTTDANAAYRSSVTSSQYAQETISSAYVRADVAFLERRLLFTGGVRFEDTKITAEGPQSDPTGNYQRDANGNFIDSNATLAGVQPALILPATTANALAISRATFHLRGQKVEREYLRPFPSINASYNISENFILRSAYYYSIGRPNYVQYTGGITLPDLTVATPGNIVVNNAFIKPWTANTTKVKLEYYFSGIGYVAVSGFRRDIQNFFSTQISPITPDFLEFYNLDPAIWGNSNVQASKNFPNHAVMNGLTFEYKQALTFLPNWARGVQVFANATALRNGSQQAEQFAGVVSRVFNWGVSFARPKYRFNMNWNYRGNQRVGLFGTAAGIAPDTHNFTPKRLTIDVLGEYELTKHFALTASVRNLNDAFTDFKAYNPATPDYAKFKQRTDYSGSWSLGVKGTF